MATASQLPVGRSTTIACSNDLDPISITWYEMNSTLYEEEATWHEEDEMVVQNTDRLSITSRSNEEIRLLLNPVSTNDEGRVFRCKANSRYGSQERSIILSTYGKLTV